VKVDFSLVVDYIWWSKVHLRTGHEGWEGKYRYSCTLSITSC